MPLVYRRSSDEFAIEGRLFAVRKERIPFRIDFVRFLWQLRSSL